MSALAVLSAAMTVAMTAGHGVSSPVDNGLSGGVILAQSADCNAVGEMLAAENGGTLASASDAVQNGADVCQIIIVVRGQNGERPRRMEIVVPKS